MRSSLRALAVVAWAACAPGAHAAYAGVWFQCQPFWMAEKNYVLLEVQKGERAWSARWGADSAQGPAAKDKDGNLLLRGCYSRAGKPAAQCNPAKPPHFATLPKGIADGKGLPTDAALRAGGWIHTDAPHVEQLARQCAALRPKTKG